jgi:hypothetical protein
MQLHLSLCLYSMGACTAPLGQVCKTAFHVSLLSDLLQLSPCYKPSRPFSHSRCLQVASSIASLGIKRGHVVFVVAPNVPAMYELHLLYNLFPKGVVHCHRGIFIITTTGLISPGFASKGFEWFCVCYVCLFS